VGASIAANKFPGIRAATIHDVHCAHQGVEHDDMNVLTMGAKIIGPWLARDIIKAYIEAEFSTREDFRRRVGKLRILELEAAKELREEIK
jgi:ribose 5-phosphate isomerase B